MASALKVPVTKPMEKIDGFLMTGFGLAIVFGIITYVATFKEKGKSFILDFLNGKMIMPQCMGINWTVWAYARISFCLTVCLVLLYPLEFYKRDKTNITLIAQVVMHIGYVFQFSLTEKSLLNYTDLKGQPFGFFKVFASLFFYPFAFTYPSYYIWKYDVNMPHEYLAAIFIPYLIGIYIMVSSNMTKQKFREDPYHPDVAHLDHIKTHGGNHIISSGWWGYVCYPEYLGDILVAFAICAPCGKCLSKYDYILIHEFSLLNRSEKPVTLVFCSLQPIVLHHIRIPRRRSKCHRPWFCLAKVSRKSTLPSHTIYLLTEL